MPRDGSILSPLRQLSAAFVLSFAARLEPDFRPQTLEVYSNPDRTEHYESLSWGASEVDTLYRYM